MTNEEKAFAFANKNADKYINDEDPLNALRDGFLCGAEWKDQQYVNIIKEECNTSYESGLTEGERKAEARFKEYLEKKKRDLSFRSDWSAYENTIYNDCLAEIINELF